MSGDGGFGADGGRRHAREARVRERAGDLTRGKGVAGRRLP
jgi:hypothetical protein